MRQINFIIIFIVISTLYSPIVYANLADDTLELIEESYLAILEAEKVGGNITIPVMMLNQASELTSTGDENDLREAIMLANEAKALALSIEQVSRREQVYLYIRLFIFLTLSIIVIVLIRKYGNSVYYSLWATVKRNWRIERV